MALTIDYDPGLDAMVLKAFGKVTYQDIAHHAQELLSHPSFTVNISQLFDCTEGKLSLTAEELQQLAVDFTRLSLQMGFNRRLAIVLSRDVDYGITRQYEALFQPDPRVEIRAFRSLENAHQWLRQRAGDSEPSES